MKSKLLFCFIILFSVFVFSQDKPKKDEKMEIINAHIKKGFNITLKSNITTGYRWAIENNYDSTIVKLLSNAYVPNKTKLVGAGGVENWKFKPLKKGKTIITLKYIRPWEKDKEPADLKKYKINVQ